MLNVWDWYLCNTEEQRHRSVLGGNRVPLKMYILYILYLFSKSVYNLFLIKNQFPLQSAASYDILLLPKKIKCCLLVTIATVVSVHKTFSSCGLPTYTGTERRLSSIWKILVAWLESLRYCLNLWPRTVLTLLVILWSQKSDPSHCLLKISSG